MFIGVLNVPFVLLAWKFAGIRTAARTAFGVAVLTVATFLLHHVHPLTDEFLLALGYGGALLGVGIGLALRYGGALDGTESLAHILSDKTNLDVDKILLGINFFIFGTAAFVNSPEQAMASFLLFYLVVAPIVKKVMEGGSETKMVQIISRNHTEVGEMIHKEWNKKIIYTDAHNDDVADNMKIVTTFVSRLEENRLIGTVEEIDPDAIIILNDASSVRGGKFNRKH